MWFLRCFTFWIQDLNCGMFIRAPLFITLLTFCIHKSFLITSSVILLYFFQISCSFCFVNVMLCCSTLRFMTELTRDLSSPCWICFVLKSTASCLCLCLPGIFLTLFNLNLTFSHLNLLYTIVLCWTLIPAKLSYRSVMQGRISVLLSLYELTI
jgi:hypothetical protein